MKKKIVYFDMDGPLADFCNAIGRPVGHPRRGIYETSPDVLRPMNEEGFFRNLEVTEGAMESVNEILNMDHLDCYIATKAATFDKFHSATEKIEWLKEHFPTLVKKAYITTGCKTRLMGDFLIDDSLHYKKKFNGTFIHFDVTQPLDSWKEVVYILKNIKD